jgi:hypothetical protein
MNNALIQTGRTTRTIEKAVQLASAGRAVYVLVSQQSHIKGMEHRIQEVWDYLYAGRGPHGIKVEGPKSGTGFDWDRLRVPGAHPNCEFLLDHDLVERRIEELHDQMADLAKEIGRLYPLTV